jgi:hypothetical protein
VGRPAAALALLAITAALSGCSELEGGRGGAAELAAAETPPREPELEKRIPRKWKGAHALRYERAYRVCSVFTVKELARHHRVAAKPKVAARAQAGEYQKRYRQAAFHGCLDALHGRAPGIR